MKLHENELHVNKNEMLFVGKHITEVLENGCTNLPHLYNVLKCLNKVFTESNIKKVTHKIVKFQNK